MYGKEGFLNSKHEIRNSKQIQMTKIQNPKRLFDHSDLEIVSDFDIRVSDFWSYAFTILFFHRFIPLVTFRVSMMREAFLTIH